MPSKSVLKFLTASVGLLLCAVGTNAISQADPVAVLTQHNDNARTGANLSETLLTPQNVNTSQFGKLFAVSLDSCVLGQVLYVPNVQIGGAAHNVIYAATGCGEGKTGTHASPSSVYAIDADDPNGTILWRHILSPNGQWMTAAPVIDMSMQTIYLVTKVNGNGGDTQLHAVDMITGVEKPGSPIVVSASVRGTGAATDDGMVTFDTSQQNARPALLLSGGDVYIAFSNATDTPPYHGWVMGYHYDGSQFTQTGVFCDTPNSRDGGIWMAGNGLAADSSGNIYLSTGNGGFDTDSSGDGDYAMSFVKLRTPSLALEDYFTPEEEPEYSKQDEDVNCSGLLLIPGANRLFSAPTKYGSSYVLDTTNLGGFAPSSNQTNIVQAIDGITQGEPYGNSSVCFDTGKTKYLYIWPAKGDLFQYSFDPVAGMVSPASPVYSAGPTTGASLAVTANGSTNGILWAVQFNGVVNAYDATNITKRLYSSTQNKDRDGSTSLTHFGSLTVTNGKLYVPTNDSQIVVFGLLHSTTSVLHDVADAAVKAGTSANTNYGATTTFCIHRAGNNSTNSANRATYIQFDLTDVTTAPTSSQLTINLNSSSLPKSGGTATLNVYGSSASWSESDITWNSAPDLNRTNFSLTSTLVTNQSVPVQAGPVTFDVTSFISANIGKVVTFELDDPNIDGATLYGVTKEGASAKQPTLTLSGV